MQGLTAGGILAQENPTILFCCRYLAIGNLCDANVLLEELRSGAPSANEDAPPVPDSPLLHFLRFLLLT